MKLNKFDFGEAIKSLKKGYRVCREGWNGKGMWLELDVIESDGTARVHEPRHHPVSAETGLCLSYKVQNFIWMKTAQDTYVPWLASQSDVLSEDWIIVK